MAGKKNADKAKETKKPTAAVKPEPKKRGRPAKAKP
jgi:hypothetical protein